MWERKHFLSIYDLSSDDAKQLIEKALDLKQQHHAGRLQPLLRGKAMAMIFRKPSLRTRISFEMGIVGLGGHALYISDDEIKLGRREAVSDAARVISRYVDIMMIRTFAQAEVEELARWATVPVINGLTDLHHPCQVLGDILTMREKKGRVENLKVAFLGDGNNLANSWIDAAAKLRFKLVLGLAKGYEPDASILERARKDGADVAIVYDPLEAAREADVVYTDVWASMGSEAEAEERKRAMKHLQVNDDLLKVAKRDVIVMHCLPAHRGDEITDGVMDGKHSVVFDEAENRMHMQRAIMVELLLK
ncbi:MAG TPA: ornithine carbamoyltransferase [bacterium]|nr:ornithine carbamoyltransferase [bacterium]